MAKQKTTRTRKILFVITKGTWGGAGAYVETLAKKAQQEEDFVVSVITGNRGELNKRLDFANIPNTVLPIQNSLHPLRLYGEISTVLSYLKANSPDIVHSNSNKAGIVTSLAIFLYNLFSPKKIISIFTIHGHAFNEDRNSLQKLYITAAEMCVFILTDRLICVSKKVYEDIPFTSLFARKTSIIYNGIPSFALYRKDEAREKLQIHNHEVPHFVTIAELNDTKNHVYLLRELTTYTKPYMYHIIGTGTHEKSIRDFIQAHHLDQNVVLHGHIENASRYLQAFDVFILPSKTEALSYAIQEAGRAGIRTIASRVGGLPELLPNTHLFALDDGEELKQLLLNIETLPPHTTYFKEEDMLAETFALYRK